MKSALLPLVVLVFLSVFIVESEVFFARDLSYYWFGAMCMIVYVCTKRWLGKKKD